VVELPRWLGVVRRCPLRVAALPRLRDDDARVARFDAADERVDPLPERPERDDPFVAAFVRVFALGPDPFDARVLPCPVRDAGLLEAMLIPSLENGPAQAGHTRCAAL
jgi:hypothetical protein